MLHLIPAPAHRWLYRVAYRLRAYWRRLVRPSVLGISVIAQDGHGRVLLVRHSYGSRRWALPGGGRGRREEPESCARREMREELGCELSYLALIEISYRKIHGASDRSHVFAARVEGEPQPDGREIIEAGWFSLDALPSDMVQTSRRQLDRFRGS
jgi:8-oxo-dGTP pyrophosphatase MutT (NUDIX family)